MAEGQLSPSAVTELAQAVLHLYPPHLRAAVAILIEPTSPYLESRALDLCEWVLSEADQAGAQAPPRRPRALAVSE